MDKNLVRLSDGVLIEIEPNEEKYKQVSGSSATAAFKDIEEYLNNLCGPIAGSLTNLKETLNITQSEIKFSIGIEASGNIFVAKSSASANFEIKLIVKNSEE